MGKMIFAFVLLITFLTSGAWAASNIIFDQIDQNELEQIIQDFSSNFTFTTVSGASSLGKLFGLEVGLVAGLTKTPQIEKFAKEQDPTSDVSVLPHGGLIAMVSIPMGLSFEAMVIPKLDAGDGEFSNTGLGVKWTFTDAILPLPLVDLAIRGHLTSTKFEYYQVINAVNTQVEFSDTITGVQLLAGLGLPVFKPYVGVGTISADGEFDIKGSNTIFNFTSATKVSKKVTDTQFLVGAELTLIIFKAGLEYSKQFGTDRFTGKLALSF